MHCHFVVIYVKKFKSLAHQQASLKFITIFDQNKQSPKQVNNTINKPENNMKGGKAVEQLRLKNFVCTTSEDLNEYQHYPVHWFEN